MAHSYVTLIETTPPTPTLQALDPIGFEHEYTNEERRLVTPVTDESPAGINRMIKKVKTREKRFITLTHTLSSIGTGLGSTLGVLMRFTAPVSIGGGGIYLTPIILLGYVGISLTAALCLAVYIYKRQTKEAIKNSGKLLIQIDISHAEIQQRGQSVRNKLVDSFKMLVEMQLTLQKLRNINIGNPSSETSFILQKTQIIQNRIDQYINFLVIQPDHPNLKKIENQSDRDHASERASYRQQLIRAELNKACDAINTGNITLKNYVIEHRKTILACYPSLRLKGSKNKMPIIINKPTIGLAFLGGFSGTFGLSYNIIGLLNVFIVLPMVFPPIYAILGLGLMIGVSIAYSMYCIKRKEIKRSIKLKDNQKHCAYYERAKELLDHRYTKELIKNNKYYSRDSTAIIQDHINEEKHTQKTIDLETLSTAKSKNDLTFEEERRPSPPLSPIITGKPTCNIF